MHNEDQYPEIAELKDNWVQLGELFLKSLDELTAEDLAKPVSRPFPINDGSKFGTLIFCTSHEAYHLGQLFGWWKTLDKDPTMQVLYQD